MHSHTLAWRTSTHTHTHTHTYRIHTHTHTHTHTYIHTQTNKTHKHTQTKHTNTHKQNTNKQNTQTHTNKTRTNKTHKQSPAWPTVLQGPIEMSAKATQGHKKWPMTVPAPTHVYPKFLSINIMIESTVSLVSYFFHNNIVAARKCSTRTVTITYLENKGVVLSGFPCNLKCGTSLCVESMILVFECGTKFNKSVY